MTTPSDTPPAALQTRPGTSRFELTATAWSDPARREPISVWALLKDALNTRNSPGSPSPDSQPNESFVVTRPAPLTPAPESRREVQSDRRAAPLRLQQAERKQQNALQIIGRDQPEMHAMINSLWGRQACSDYIQGLIMNGDDGMAQRRPRLKLETLTALLELDGLHDIHLGQLRDAAGVGRRPHGSH